MVKETTNNNGLVSLVLIAVLVIVLIIGATGFLTYSKLTDTEKILTDINGQLVNTTNDYNVATGVISSLNGQLVSANQLVAVTQNQNTELSNTNNTLTNDKTRLSEEIVGLNSNILSLQNDLNVSRTDFNNLVIDKNNLLFDKNIIIFDMNTKARALYNSFIICLNIVKDINVDTNLYIGSSLNLCKGININDYNMYK
jgi:cell division protein FtsI/penicillin-binding protein 2